MKYKTLKIICLVTLFCSQAYADEYTEFWSWFQKSQAQYYSMDFDNRAYVEELFDSLSLNLNKIDENLTFEFGKLPDGRMDFVISAGGIGSTFPHVMSLVDKSPIMKDWKVTAFRQPKDVELVIEMGTVKLDPKKVLGQLYRDEGKIGVVMYIPGFKKTPERLYEQLGFLLLDQTLGEYVVGTKVGFIEFENLDGEIESAYKINEIRQFFESK